MAFLRPLSRRGFAALHAAQVREQAPLEAQGLLIAWLERYFALRTLTQGEWSSFVISQFSLAKRDKFLGREAWMPRPP